MQYRYIHRYGPSLKDFDAPHAIEAHDNKQVVGSMLWGPEIHSLYVTEPYRRKGIATKMFNLANSLSNQFDVVRRPEHSALRTYEGEMWAGSVDPNHERPDWESAENEEIGNTHGS